MATFDALPVSGDAFLLNMEGKTVLVDGGRNPAKLVQALSGVTTLDVVICTHNDADHAKGLATLLDEKGAPSVKEFWLPGRWADQIEDLLLRPEAFVSEVVDEIEAVYETFADDMRDWPSPSEEAGDENDGPLFDDFLLDQILRPELRRQDEHEGTDPAAWAERMRSELAGASVAHLSRLLPPPVEAIEAAQRPAEDVERVCAAVSAAIEAAERIRQIARSAITHGVPIRWFDFESFDAGQRPSGGWSWLVPVNACELRRLPARSAINRLAYLTLSKANREYLVFQVVEDAHRPAVLFCGDSPLEGGQRLTWPGLPSPPSRSLLVTAPHHGRATNAGAYAVIDNWMTHAPHVSKWIKSGSMAQPCLELRMKTYLFCTGCMARRLTKARFIVRSDKTWWLDQWPPCPCRDPSAYRTA